MKIRIQIKYAILLFVFLYACGTKNTTPLQSENLTPQVTEDGLKIVFPDEKNVAFFETEKVSSSTMNSNVIAPAKVSATIIKSDEGASQNIVLFENPDLAANYTLLLQHLININQIQNVNIKQRKNEYERTKDLSQHGAATGRDLSETQTALSMEESNLANERAALIEHETKLKAGGFQPENLRKAEAGTAYITCDIPENQISKIKEGSECIIQFTSFPNETFKGKIEDVADLIDQSTRMLKLRVSVNNSNGRLKAGMFATVSFNIGEGNNISISKNSLITIQAKNYVFVKTSSNAFERREVITGNQIGDRIIVYSGLKSGELIAVKGAIQLKGLSFGY